MSAAPEPRPLTNKQRRAARLQAYGHNRETIAARVDVAVRTLANWRTNALYTAEVNRIALEMPEEDATAVLRDLLHSDQDAVRLRAAEALLKIPADERTEPARHDAKLIIYDHAARKA